MSAGSRRWVSGRGRHPDRVGHLQDRRNDQQRYRRRAFFSGFQRLDGEECWLAAILLATEPAEEQLAEDGGGGEGLQQVVLGNRCQPSAANLLQVGPLHHNIVVAAGIEHMAHRLFGAGQAAGDDAVEAQQLAALGMQDAFDSAKADFSGMTGSRELMIGSILHQATIDVNEEGTEAAAATMVEMSLTSMPGQSFTIHFDKPFIYVIYETTTNAVVFMGRVVNP